MAENDPLSDIVEIHADEVDVEAIMRTIRANLQQRRVTAQAQGLNFEALASGVLTQNSGRFAPEVYAHLRRANATAARIAVSQQVSEQHIPLIGRMLQRMRQALHQLVVYYVNMLAGKQMLFNESIAAAVTGMTADMEHDAELASLRAEIQALHARLAALEANKDMR
jgi:branched-subunit amino acid aminotransferase/4-amino-4-deoxychorismate lyase